jgi:nucleotide-binding universal stress UspA family protein
VAARHALGWAVDEARARDAVLEVVHAWQPPYVGGFPFTGAAIDYATFEEWARALVDDVLARVEGAGLAAPIERTVVCAGPASALLEAAQRADVLVVGARGIGGVQRFLLGSVSHQVALHASRPVVVVPAPTDD